MNPTLKQEDLGHFTGSETLWRHVLRPNMFYTDGVKYVAQAGEAYWLLDVIVSAQMLRRVKREEFQVWGFKVDGSSGVIVADDGNGKELFIQEIPFTDFPLPEIKFYVRDHVVMLPSEY